jgi:hypothetical protein
MLPTQELNWVALILQSVLQLMELPIRVVRLPVILQPPVILPLMQLLLRMFLRKLRPMIQLMTEAD